MLRRMVRLGIVGVALGGPLVGACVNLDLEDDCHFTLSCPPDGGPDAEAGPDTGDQE
jgi:hypothetical protein